MNPFFYAQFFACPFLTFISYIEAIHNAKKYLYAIIGGKYSFISGDSIW